MSTCLADIADDGGTVIPEAVLRALGVGAGDEIGYEIDEAGCIWLRPPERGDGAI